MNIVLTTTDDLSGACGGNVGMTYNSTTCSLWPGIDLTQTSSIIYFWN